MGKNKPQAHLILREALRHYPEFKAFVTQTGQSFIEYKGYVLSFYDLDAGLESLAPRKKEAVYYNVILDMKQKDVAKIMGIRTVSVGQYVDSAVRQLAKRYFPELEDDDDDVEG